MATSDTDQRYIMLGLRIIGEFGAIIAVPVVLFVILGTKLDAHYATKPLFLVLGFVLAFILSAVSITRKAKQFAEQYERIGRDADAEKMAEPADSANDSESTSHPDHQ